jgi:hypothetical protein
MHNAVYREDCLSHFQCINKESLLEMEASMTVKNQQDHKGEPPAKLEFEVMDSSGMWFVAAAVFALLAAGVIIYRAANNDIHIASSGATSAPVSHLR